MAEILETQHPIDEPVYTVDELAKQLKVHPSTVRRLFIDQEGVIRLGHGRLRSKKTVFQLENSGQRRTARFQRDEGGVMAARELSGSAGPAVHCSG